MSVESLGGDFVYPFQNKFIIPLKNTVTGINSKKMQDEGFKVKSVMDPVKQYDFEDKAKIGVEYHSALELLDLKRPYEKNSDFKLVDYNKIKLAHEKLSPLVKDAIAIKKEAEFTMFIPYNQIVYSDVEDRVLIQGVVDLLIEKENSIVLVDYKFSSLPAKVLKNKYLEQLNLYKLAIEEAYKKPVEHMFIYSINSGELI